jgi:succinate-acetate transporter protein
MLLGGILEFILGSSPNPREHFLVIADVFPFAGNTFSSVVFCSYGAYWFSYAAIFTPSFNAAIPVSLSNRKI